MGGEAAGDVLTAAVALGVKDRAGAGVNDVDAGEDTGGPGEGGGLGVAPEQAASGTLARMPSTITNRPGIRTVRV
jgi:hypothetical protein